MERGGVWVNKKIYASRCWIVIVAIWICQYKDCKDFWQFNLGAFKPSFWKLQWKKGPFVFISLHMSEQAFIFFFFVQPYTFTILTIVLLICFTTSLPTHTDTNTLYKVANDRRWRLAIIGSRVTWLQSVSQSVFFYYPGSLCSLSTCSINISLYCQKMFSLPFSLSLDLSPSLHFQRCFSIKLINCRVAPLQHLYYAMRPLIIHDIETSRLWNTD